TRNLLPDGIPMKRTAAPTLGLAVSLALLFPAPVASAETIYVSNEKDNTITVVDGDKLEVTATIPVGERPRGILLSKDGKSLYVCVSDEDRIAVVDLETNEVRRHLPSGSDPELFALSP